MAKKKAQSALRILVANGVNLDMLGRREVAIYGAGTLKELEEHLRAHADGLAKSVGLNAVELSFFQSNDEAELYTELDKRWDGILINPGAWTHTSIALADRLKALGVPYVEVHLSNIAAREEFRHQSYTAPHAVGVVFGLGFDSYLAGLLGLMRHLA